MRARTVLLALPLLSSLACGGTDPVVSAPPAPVPSAPSSVASAAALDAPPAPIPEAMTEDTSRATSGGTTFTVPAGWTIAVDAGRSVLRGPESGLNIVITESPAKTPEEAVAAAWTAIRPDFKRPLHLAEAEPARNGWEEIHRYTYETSPDEKLFVLATALRAGSGWVVFAIEASEGVLEKRGGAVSLVAQSLRRKGYAKESFAGKTPHELDAARIRDITDTVEKGRLALDIPGVAMSLVQKGKVVFAGGLGVRELGKSQKVDADALFLIASNTKALTTLLLAKEVDEKKFTWETPVTSVYPDFKLGSAETTEKVLMKHLVCACTGLPRQDLEWLFSFKDATPASEIGLLSGFQPTTKFGESFQYSNLMAAAAGFIGGHVAYPKKELGAAYDQAMQEKLLGPMGMTRTTFDFARAMSGNHASPHGQDVDGAMKIASMDINRAIVPLRPAGGVWSSAKDLTKYVQLELANGKLPSGKTLVSESSLLARRAPQVAVGEFTTYGMGLEVDTEWGIPVVHHGGDLVGYHSDMFWLPEQGVGGVILTNAEGGWSLRGPFLRKVLEVLFDGHPEALEDVIAASARQKANIAKDRERLVLPASQDVTAMLAKRYTNDALGELTIKSKGKDCIVDVGEWSSTVASKKNDDGTFSLVTAEPGVGIELVLGTRDSKKVLVLRDAQHEYVFAEAP